MQYKGNRAWGIQITSQCYLPFSLLFVVTGEANFTMETTSLTIGGFSQPSRARTLIEQSGSVETGLAQLFMWVFPKPSYAKNEELEAVNEDITKLLSKFPMHVPIMINACTHYDNCCT